MQHEKFSTVFRIFLVPGWKRDTLGFDGGVRLDWPDRLGWVVGFAGR